MFPFPVLPLPKLSAFFAPVVFSVLFFLVILLLCLRESAVVDIVGKILTPALLLGLWAQMRVQSTYAKFSKVRSVRGVTADQIAREILDRNGLYQVRVERIAGNLTDHFDPRANVIRLSESVYHSTSVASIGVAAHEVGHAIQYSKGYLSLIHI